MRSGPSESPRVLALVAAYNEEERIGRTVKVLRAVRDVDDVFVVTDGSTDATAEEAAAAGARVIRANLRMGKGDALERALSMVPAADVYLLMDGDVEDTAAEAAKLLEPVRGGRLDLAVGRFPPQPGGGFGLVKHAARRLVRAAGFDAEEPLSGQRAVTKEALAAARPLARRFGAEVGMTIDLARLGFRIGEVPVQMTHRPTGRRVRGFLHRGRQGRDILMAAVPRLLGLR